PMAAMLGRPREQLVGLPLRGCLDDRGHAATRWLARCHAGEAQTHQTRLVRAGGAHRWAQLSGAPLPAAGGDHGCGLCMVTDITQLLSRAIGEHIQLDISADPNVWPVRAERGPLEQVLVNLAVNARDAMRRGGELTIHAANTVVEPGHLDDPALAGRFVRVTVADTGAGMDAEVRQRAFEPFFTTKPAAAGLGLATAA